MSEAEDDVRRADTFDGDECPGEGKCHGPQSWCQECGDVVHVCDARLRGERCDEHRVPPPWHELRAARAAAESELRRAENAARAARDLLQHITDQEVARRLFERQLRAQEEADFSLPSMPSMPSTARST